MNIRKYESAEAFLKEYPKSIAERSAVQTTVAGILTRVRNGGDRAVKELTEQFDGVKRDVLRVTLEEKQGAINLSKQERELVEAAARNIRFFHEQEKKQLRSWFRNSDGCRIGQMVSPLRRVGIYIPGGTAVYPSSVLMNVIPAQVAGVEEIVLVSPPSPQFASVHPLILAVAQWLGIKEIYGIGGAQAIAALAYGTESIEPVEKITGPGNQYVAEAKRQLFGVVGIDSVAGPSEITIVADETANPVFLAADLLSQAEHDPEARAVLLSTSRRILDETRQQLNSQIQDLPRAQIARQALVNHGAFVLVNTLDEAIELTNKMAPEHLELQVSDPGKWLEKVRCAGAVFIGKHTPEPVGDYWAGSNHVLPTAGNARFASALSVRDFLRWTSVTEYNRNRLKKDLKQIARFARLEGLEAHARAVEIRF